jgi:hypothetical protein
MNSNDIGWNHIIIEGYCFRTTSIKKGKYCYELLEGGKTKKIPNKDYDPKYKTPKKPKFCKDKICQDCYFNDCPHLGTSEVPDEDYKMIMKAIEKVYKETYNES